VSDRDPGFHRTNAVAHALWQSGLTNRWGYLESGHQTWTELTPNGQWHTTLTPRPASRDSPKRGLWLGHDDGQVPARFAEHLQDPETMRYLRETMHLNR
jgi:hypothetical protein